ncbi:MAG: hypothetical protein ACE5KI_07000 [Dehalococcoidia bacterium]
METILAELKRRLSRVKPWVGVSVLLGVVLLGYYAFLGMRYLSASEQVGSLNSEIRRVSASLRRPAPDQESLEGEHKLQEQRLDAVRSLSSSLHSDDLVGIVSATARETSVVLRRVGVGNTGQETLGSVRYDTQPMTLTLEGERDGIFQFLASLQQKVPLTGVPNISISSPDADPSAQVQVLFYLSPQSGSEE